MVFYCYVTVLSLQGKISELKLHVHSSFKHTMKVKSLSVVGGDPRFTFHLGEAVNISPGQKSFVGRVQFDPGAECGLSEDCYAGFLPDGKFGHPWYLGLALPLNLGDMDLAVVHSLWTRMRAAAYPNSMFNVTLRLDTSEVRGFLFSARAALSWPVLAAAPTIQFPLTQLGNSSRMEILVTNPSSKPLLMHLVPMTAYPNAQNVLNLLPNRIKLATTEDGMMDNEENPLFTIDSVTNADDPLAPLDTFGEGFAEKFGVEISDATHPLVLQPGQAARVSLLFTPVEPAGPRSSVLFLRNNLTGVEVVDLVGASALGEIKFGNRRPGSLIHAFEVTEKHLKDCDKSVSKQHSLPNLTVKRPFTARNTGKLPLWVTGFHIDSQPCQGFGFKVLDCEPFLLAANDSKKIHIAFSPDFTLSRITRTLTLSTSLGGQPGQAAVAYSLQATVPPQLLSVCSRALPRPGWEVFIYYGALSLLTVSLCCVLVAAFIEADRILKFCFLLAPPQEQTRFLPENLKPFDLKEVGRAAVAESEARAASPCTARQISQPSWGSMDMLKKINKDAYLQPNQDLNTNTHITSTSGKGRISALQKFGGFFRFLWRVAMPISNQEIQITKEPTIQNLPTDLVKPAVVAEHKKEESPPIPLPPSSPPQPTTKKSKLKKNTFKPKLTAQNSVNDELETSSTTTESSNPDDLAEPFVNKGIQMITSVGSDSSPPAPEQSKKKRKVKAKTEEPIHQQQALQPPKENKPTAPKKKLLEKQDSKPEPKVEKPRSTGKSSSAEPVKPLLSPQQSVSPPPRPKQEAKVKGVPKEVVDVRRNMSPAVTQYDRPPRLQTQPRHESVFSGNGERGQQEQQNHLSSAVKPEPPRAIILPELKQNPGNQFGPIGRKVPASPAPLSKSTWNDSPAAPAPVVSGGVIQARLVGVQPAVPGHSSHHLIPPPGLTIMQQLQAERRQREEDYHRRQNNWPGFDTETSSPSIAPAVGPQEPVRSAASSNYVDSLWDSEPQPGLWGTIGQVWPSSVFNTGLQWGGEGGAGQGRETGQAGERNKANKENITSYDSLSLSSIWSAPVQSPDQPDNSWSSLFNNNKKDI